jgi:hypothetical protein
LNIEEVRRSRNESRARNLDEKFIECNKLLQLYLPVRNGLKLAIEILGPTMATESKDAAKKYLEAIESKLDLGISRAKELQAERSAAGLSGTLEGMSFAEWSETRGQPVHSFS